MTGDKYYYTPLTERIKKDLDTLAEIAYIENLPKDSKTRFFLKRITEKRMSCTRIERDENGEDYPAATIELELPKEMQS